MNMYIPIILGTAREGRQSEKVARFILEEVEKTGLESEILDVKDYRIQATDDSGETPLAKKLAEKVIAADGFIIVSPEYNHSFPGEMKMMLDMLYKEYARKPVGICGVSGGGMGGVRGVEQLRLFCITFRMVPICEALYFSNVKELFDEKGAIKEEKYYKRTKKFLEELVWHAKALKAARS